MSKIVDKKKVKKITSSEAPKKEDVEEEVVNTEEDNTETEEVENTEEVEETEDVEVVTSKAEKLVEIKLAKDVESYIGDKWYRLKAGQVISVTANVKDILLKAGYLVAK